MKQHEPTVTILLVEDDDVDILGVRRAFKKFAITNPLVVVHDGVEALEVLRGQAEPRVEQPCIILLDLNMPRMNGIEFLEELRKDPALQNTLVFVVTTSSSEEDKLAAYRANIAGYVVKTRTGNGFETLIGLLQSYLRAVEFPGKAPRPIH